MGRVMVCWLLLSLAGTAAMVPVQVDACLERIAPWLARPCDTYELPVGRIWDGVLEYRQSKALG
jgi:hypothetical protein